MAIGRLQWFGGQNKKTGKVNHFGFISLLENNKLSEVYVNRHNIDQNIQDLLENRNSEGIYLEFDIDTDNQRQQAINVKLMTLVGIVEWFRDGRGYIKCENRSDVRINSNEIFYQEELLYFGLHYNSKFDKDEAILVEKVDYSTENSEIIEKCINSNDFNILRKFIPQYIEYLKDFSLDEVFLLVQDKLSKLSNDKYEELLDKLSQEYPDLFIVKSQLRTLLKENDYLKLVNNYLESDQEEYRQNLINEIISKISQLSEVNKNIYWSQINYLRKNLEYKNFLWDIAPFDYKKKIIKNKFQSFFQIVSDFQESDYPYSEHLSQNWGNLYKLDENEQNLIKKWDSSLVNNPFNEAKMISARGAEKLVINFSRHLGYQVEDISIHQITQESQDWIKGDIKINFQQLLDVKNARTDVNYKVYSEFCVPQFKKNRGNDVKIVGVLSPYLQKEYMKGKISTRFRVANPIILGSFDKQELQYLEKIFSDTILKLNVSRDGDPNNYLPPWVFDYDNRFYIKQTELINKFNRLPDSKIPSWEDLLLIETDFSQIFSLFIASKRKLPQEWSAKLPQWKANFINYLINLPCHKITLPYLFLSILKHFLSMLSDQGNDYNPQEYKQIFSTPHPLKIYDPLNIINDFCDSLESIWQYREQAKLDQFKIFKFTGKGLLQGQRFEGDQLTTLLAYCGGWIEGKGKCGFRPLVIGKHLSCPECNYLICPQDNCGFCSQNCSSYLQRKQNQNKQSNPYYSLNQWPNF